MAENFRQWPMRISFSIGPAFQGLSGKSYSDNELTEPITKDP